MSEQGISHGNSGNVSRRMHLDGVDGVSRDGFWITPSGLDYASLTDDDLVWVALDFEIDGDDFPLSGGRDVGSPWREARRQGLIVGDRAPSSEWRFHRDLYRARTEFSAIVHSHAIYATAAACLPRVQSEGVPPFHYMMALAGGHNLRCAPYHRFGSHALSAAAVAAMQDRSACLLAHHGLLAAGGSLREALSLAVEVEALCKMYLSILAAGEPALLSQQDMQDALESFKAYRNANA